MNRIVNRNIPVCLKTDKFQRQIKQPAAYILEILIPLQMWDRSKEICETIFIHSIFRWFKIYSILGHQCVTHSTDGVNLQETIFDQHWPQSFSSSTDPMLIIKANRFQSSRTKSDQDRYVRKKTVDLQH